MADFDFLKETLGDDLFAQVSEKLNGAQNIRLVNAADGSYVPKEKMDQLAQSNGQYKAQIKELTTKLTGMQSSADNVEELKRQLAEAQTSLTEKDAAIKRQMLEFRVKDAIRASKAKNADLVLRSIDMSKISEDNGNLIGLSDQLEALKKSDGYLFADEPGQSGGVDPHQEPSGEKPSANSIINAAIRQAAGY